MNNTILDPWQNYSKVSLLIWDRQSPAEQK